MNTVIKNAFNYFCRSCFACFFILSDENEENYLNKSSSFFEFRFAFFDHIQHLTYATPSKRQICIMLIRKFKLFLCTLSIQFEENIAMLLDHIFNPLKTSLEFDIILSDFHNISLSKVIRHRPWNKSNLLDTMT